MMSFLRVVGNLFIKFIPTQLRNTIFSRFCRSFWGFLIENEKICYQFYQFKVVE